MFIIQLEKCILGNKLTIKYFLRVKIKDSMFEIVYLILKEFLKAIYF